MSYKYSIGPLEIVLERRSVVTKRVSLAVSIAAIGVSIVATGLLFVAIGRDPVEAYSVIASVFTDPKLIRESLARSVPIILATLGLIVAFRMGFWNIGGEGQIYMGMFAATGVVLWQAATRALPDPLVLPVMYLAAFLAGGVWGLIPAFLKARLQVNEVLTTLMMNYIAILFVDYLVYGPWKDPEGYGFPLTIQFPDYARLPDLDLGVLVNSGIIACVILAGAVHYVLTKTKLGYEIRVVGESMQAARYAGISYLRVALLGMLISAGLAGLGGMSVVSGIIGRLRPRASPGYGYTAIIAAFLAGLNPWVAIPVGILFGGLITAGGALQAALKIPFASIQMFQAVLFIFVIMGEFLKRYKVGIRVVGR